MSTWQNECRYGLPPAGSRPPRPRIRTQQQHTSRHNGTRHHRKDRTRLPPALHQRRPATILGHGINIIRKPTTQTRHRQHPKDNSKRESEIAFQRGGLGFQVEGDEDGDGDDGHVDAEAQPGEEGALVGAVVAGVAVGVGEEEGAVEGAGEDDGAGVVSGEESSR